MKGEKNWYICKNDHVLITVDRDQGTTPFMTPCRYPGCGTSGQSSFYRVDNRVRASHEWYKPKSVLILWFKYRLRKRGKWIYRSTIHHIEKGGLILRKIPWWRYDRGK